MSVCVSCDGRNENREKLNKTSNERNTDREQTRKFLNSILIDDIEEIQQRIFKLI